MSNETEPTSAITKKYECEVGGDFEPDNLSAHVDECIVNSRPPVEVKVVENKIEQALQQLEHIDAQRISVEYNEHSVVLRGNVKTWREHEAASKAAAGIDGVIRVQNELRVVPWLF